MKIAIGQIIQHGPFGGGNSLALSFRRLFTQAGHAVVVELEDGDIDSIMITDPRSRSPNVAFSAGAAWRYLARRNPRALVVQLIQDCDERKGTRAMNRRQRIAKGAGLKVQDVNQLLKQFREMKKMMKTMMRLTKKGRDVDMGALMRPQN